MELRRDATGFLGCKAGGYLARRLAARALPICSCRHPACAAFFRRWLSRRPSGIPVVPLVLGRCHRRRFAAISTLNALFAPSGLVGSALTIANCIRLLHYNRVDRTSRGRDKERRAATCLPDARPRPLLGLVALRRLIEKPELAYRISSDPHHSGPAGPGFRPLRGPPRRPTPGRPGPRSQRHKMGRARLH